MGAGFGRRRILIEERRSSSFCRHSWRASRRRYSTFFAFLTSARTAQEGRSARHSVPKGFPIWGGVGCQRNRQRMRVEPKRLRVEEARPAKAFTESIPGEPDRACSFKRTFQLSLPHRAAPWRYGGDCRTLGFPELDESADSVPR